MSDSKTLVDAIFAAIAGARAFFAASEMKYSPPPNRAPVLAWNNYFVGVDLALRRPEMVPALRIIRMVVPDLKSHY